MRSELRLVVAVAVITLGGLGAIVVSCTDGTTPDCTGDAAASCGPLPGSIEAGGSAEGGEGGSTEAGGNGTEAGGNQGMDSSMTQDTGSTMDMDAGTDGDALLGDI
jgi:hypothetical protein